MNNSIRQMLRIIRRISKFWIAKRTLSHLESIRTRELRLVVNILPSNGRLLEIGAGTGWQAKALEGLGYDVFAVDLPSSNYSRNRVWNVTEYDGKKLPYADKSFDIVYSSNVLEHVPHICEFQNEIHRVIRKNGIVIHVLPSSSWRFWTNLTHILKCWTIPKVHGEHAKNALTEIYYFRRRWWVRLFSENGWTIVNQISTGLFYTGHSIMDSRLSISDRSKLSRIFGSSCNIFVLKQKIVSDN